MKLNNLLKLIALIFFCSSFIAIKAANKIVVSSGSKVKGVSVLNVRKTAENSSVYQDTAETFQVVNIAEPEAISIFENVSYNAFDSFDINLDNIQDNMLKGVYLNNQVRGKKEFLHGNSIEGKLNTSASLIIIDILSSANNTNINGFVNVVGEKAKVWVQNKNGSINCNNCSFGNISNLELTATSVNIKNTNILFSDMQNKIQRFLVSAGTIDIVNSSIEAQNVLLKNNLTVYLETIDGIFFQTYSLVPKDLITTTIKLNNSTITTDVLNLVGYSAKVDNSLLNVFNNINIKTEKDINFIGKYTGNTGARSNLTLISKSGSVNLDLTGETRRRQSFKSVDLQAGLDINVKSVDSGANGSVYYSAGRDINISNSYLSYWSPNKNITLSANNNINITNSTLTIRGIANNMLLNINSKAGNVNIQEALLVFDKEINITAEKSINFITKYTGSKGTRPNLNLISNDGDISLMLDAKKTRIQAFGNINMQAKHNISLVNINLSSNNNLILNAGRNINLDNSYLNMQTLFITYTNDYVKNNSNFIAPQGVIINKIQ